MPVCEKTISVHKEKEEIATMFMWGLESEGYLTNDNGDTCFYSYDWLGGTSEALGSDGRDDTVEYRSEPFTYIGDMIEHITELLAEKRIPQNSMMIFHPYAYNDSEEMPCGLHISMSWPKWRKSYSSLEDKTCDYKSYVENKIPMKLLKVIEGEAGEERREHSGYGVYDGYDDIRIKWFSNTKGLEYRVLSSCMSDFELFKAIVGTYMWISWVYWYQFMYKDSSDNRREKNFDKSLYEEMTMFLGETDNSSINNYCYINAIKNESYSQIKEVFKNFSGLDIVECIEFINYRAESGIELSRESMHDVLFVEPAYSCEDYCSCCLRSEYYCDC